ncbi:terminase TerL endonuclease subunit [Sphaerisporangium sp. TRM90804]|uniref:terminase large subunit n=1 Tax=Sphaerisporangium sp. TRM90804 TaxID=3031113 RepID=UPI0024470082|nr:terminase TerL endonuclease subunit [Sphaerisporangium sp. TRM90804]MDH2425773.1 terminase large subunit [Sphaerisporangium sp. TRM90804]
MSRVDGKSPAPAGTRRRGRGYVPSAAELKRLKLSPEVAWYLQDRGIPLPDCPPTIKTPEAGELLKTARFDPERVDKVLAAFRQLRHTKGRWAGQPLNPDPWQVAYVIAPVFGWVKKNRRGQWVRVVRSLYVDVPRKNGKSTLCGGLGLYLTAADGEGGAEVVAAATTKEQANYVFGPIKALCDHAPAVKPYVKSLAQKIIHKATGSTFCPVASVAEALHGGNIHGGIIDELHVHKDGALVEAIETGTGSRDQPLIVIITTADDGRTNTIYARKRKRVEELARRVIRHASTYGVVWGADEKDDPFAVATWKKANPGFGISPTHEYLEEKAAEARQDPAVLASFLRLHLGIRTKQTTRYITLADWDGAAAIVEEAALAGRACHGGLDLSNVEDVTALCWLFPDREAGTFDAVWRFWLPEARLKDLNKRTAENAEVWVREGWLTLTAGNVIDLEAVEAQIDKDAQVFAVQTVGYDRWGATDVVRRLGEKGMTCVPISQGAASLNDPLKNVLRTLKAGLFRQGGHPVMRWMIDNLATVATHDGALVKPDRANSGDKIDGVSALVNAMKECMDAQQAEQQAPPAAADSAAPWDDRDLWRPTGRLNI